MLISRTRIGPYEIVAPLEVGGIGEVYLARDTRLNRQVAALWRSVCGLEKAGVGGSIPSLATTSSAISDSQELKNSSRARVRDDPLLAAFRLVANRVAELEANPNSQLAFA